MMDTNYISVAIRGAAKEDLEAILQLYAEVEDETEPTLKLDEAKKIFKRIQSYPDYQVFVAQSDKQVVGTFALLIMDNMTHFGSKSGVIESVVVKKTMQGKGIGKQMMAHAIELCKAKSCYKVALSSNLKRYNAHRFYERIGFEHHGYSYLMELKQP